MAFGQTALRGRGQPAIAGFAGSGMLFCLLALWSAQVRADLTAVQQAELWQAHNVFRQGAQPRPCNPLPNMKWNSALASVAQTYSEQCRWEHNNQRLGQANTAGGPFGSVGENLAFSTNLQKNITEMAVAWKDEVKDYNLESNKCSAVCGHYTQLVWNATTEVGCGLTICQTASFYNFPFDSSRWPQALYLVCNYAPGGNILGQKPYQACGSGSSVSADRLSIMVAVVLIAAGKAFLSW